jgi:hypothetical protein
MIYVKMIQFGTKIGPFAIYVFVFFLHRAQRISVFHETLRDHIEYGDIHVHIFSIFLQFKIHFPYKGSICT